ncbi:F-box/LRR-repeat protein 4 [Hibiscus syriacus]|uniref:F-box/LRR-repeat protein 4 n=1 Tax=Hibiscus syriacus TaxID=106335 RepID=A0A6A3A2C3_HIBSY|nr:F-box/LRR-repeat protein 4 [Hibiscus syriacus]
MANLLRHCHWIPDSKLISNKGITAIAQGCPLLKVLKLQCVNVTDWALMAVGFLVCYWKCWPCTVSSSLQTRAIALSDRNFLGERGLEAIASGCTEFTHLEVNGCHNIGTIGLESVGKSCPRLTELPLLYCKRIGNFALTEVGRGFKHLQALHLVDCSSLGDEAICSIAKGCRNLKKLQIRGCYEEKTLAVEWNRGNISSRFFRVLFLLFPLSSLYLATVSCRKLFDSL